MKVILSIMAEYQHENFALERWRSKFATEMLNVDNCLDVIVFLDDCHRNVGFVQDLKKLGSFYLIQHWPLVQQTRRWAGIRSEPNSLLKIFRELRNNLDCLVTATSGRGNNFELVFIVDKYNSIDSANILSQAQASLLRAFFELDLMVLHNFWIKFGLDFRSAVIWSSQDQPPSLMHLTGSPVTKPTPKTHCCQSSCFHNHSFNPIYLLLSLFIVLVTFCFVAEVLINFPDKEPVRNFVPEPDRRVCGIGNKSEKLCSARYL